MKYEFNPLMQWRFKEIIGEKTQEQVAEMLGCVPGQVNMLLSGKRKIHTVWIKKISEAFEIPAWHLFVDPKDIIPKEYQELMEGYLSLDDDRRREFTEAMDAARFRQLQNAEKKSQPPTHSVSSGNKSSKGHDKNKKKA